MDDDLMERLRQEQRADMENPRGCKVQMTEAGEPYPCAHNCPCALRDKLLVTADCIKELEAKLAKAVEALEKIQHNKYGISAARARTALEKVKGQDDE